MNFETMINDSVNFTRDTLLKNPIRWVIFVLLALPGGLLQFVLNIRDMTAGKTVFHWELVHWDQVAVLVILMLIGSFFLSGYLVRIYRGSAIPPEFNQWVGLFLDGIKMCVVWLIWMLPAIILMLAACGTLFGAIFGGMKSAAGLGLLVLMLILLLAALLLVLVACILGTIGAIRFARTGSVMEGVNYREIISTIERIGWWNYILAGVILLVIGIIFSILSGVLSLLPFIGWFLDLVIAPVMSVLGARFLSLVYDVGVPPATAG
jgi:hypothetical protein